MGFRRAQGRKKAAVLAAECEHFKKACRNALNDEVADLAAEYITMTTAPADPEESG
jgi:hypothetical protein